jgi:hypothetical protein
MAAWNIINNPQGELDDGVIPQVNELAAQFNVPVDQRAMRVKQDVACGSFPTLSAKAIAPEFPKWPPSPMQHGVSSRVSSVNHSNDDSVFEALTSDNLMSNNSMDQNEPIDANNPIYGAIDQPVGETLSGRTKRCLSGVAYDLTNWGQVPVPLGENRLVHILTRHDRAPITSMVLSLVAVVTLLLVIVIANRKR